MKFNAILYILPHSDFFNIGDGPSYIPLASKATKVTVRREHVIMLLTKSPVQFNINGRLFMLSPTNGEFAGTITLTSCLERSEMNRQFVESLTSGGFQINEEGIKYHEIE